MVEVLHEIYPEAPIYTSIYDENVMPAAFHNLDIRFSFMQYLPFVFWLFRAYFFLYPFAFQSFDLSSYEVILSSSSAFAKGIKKNKNQLHICYCHTPARFLWRYEDYLKRENIPDWLKFILPYFLEPIKKWDLENSCQVDYFIANSFTVAERIKRIYGRESVIINPPVDTSFYQPSEINQDYFLVVSRLTAYKRIDLVIEAFNKLDLPLKVIGVGPSYARLKKMAGPNIEFLGRVSNEEVAEHLAQCRALIFPGEEDFGIVPLEAMACGRPGIAFKAGGALETVIEGQTGLFFETQTVEALVSTINRFQFEVFNKDKIRNHALKFDKKVFKSKIGAFLKEKYEERFGH